MRKLYWYISSYARKHGWVFVLSIAAAVLFFSFLLPWLSQRVALKPRMYIAVIGDYTLTDLPKAIKNQISVGLTQVGDDLQAEPLLAERWVIEDQGKQYRFLIKKGVLWQDGKSLEPADIFYNFNDVEMISTPNEIIFNLPEAFAPFPISVTEPLLRLEEERDWWGNLRYRVIGIGPHQLTNYTLQANKLKEVQIDGPEARYVYRFYLTETDAVMAFKKGEVDVLLDLASCHDLCEWPRLEVARELAYNRYLAVFFNNSDPTLTKNVRQALAYALDKNYGEATAIGPIDPRSWAYLAGGKDYAYDRERAAERLFDDLPRAPLQLELTTSSIFLTDAEGIKAQWEDFGVFAKERCQSSKDVTDKKLCANLDIKITLRVSNFPDTNNYQLLLIGQESSIDPDQYFMWHSAQPTNFTRYKNTRIDSLLERGRQETELSQRRALYQEFQQFLLEDPPAIFLRYLENYSLAR